VFSALATSFGFATRSASLLSAGLLALGLALPVFGVRAWSTAYADRLALSFAGGLSSALRGVSFANPDPEAEPSESDRVNEWLGARVLPPAQEARAPRAHSRPSGANAVQHGVRVSASQVLALAARRAMPHAVPVKANASHPAGLLLSGVSALGIGLQDGDVLTEAAGQKATSVATVVGIVIAARGRQAPEISGRFYRGWVPYGLTVEQPYPKAPVPG